MGSFLGNAYKKAWFESVFAVGRESNISHLERFYPILSTSHMVPVVYSYQVSSTKDYVEDVVTLKH